MDPSPRAEPSLPTPPTLRTRRLVLRPWRDSDLEPFAALNADPEVMEHFPQILSRHQSDAAARRIQSHLEARGFGLWAVEIPEVACFAGFIGLAVPGFEAHFTPCVEIGWRLARVHWGRGYATEGAQEALRFGFAELGLAEIVAYTAPANRRSRAVMERLGLHRDPRDDFEHPFLPAGHSLRRHVLYRLRADIWRGRRKAVLDGG